MHPSFAWPLWSEGWHELQDRCFSSLLMHRWIRLGGFCGPIAVTSQGMRDVNCWAAFFQRKIPLMTACLASWVKLVYPRLRMWWLRTSELSRFFFATGGWHESSLRMAFFQLRLQVFTSILVGFFSVPGHGVSWGVFPVSCYGIPFLRNLAFEVVGASSEFSAIMLPRMMSFGVYYVAIR